MATISLPAAGSPNWGAPLNTAINAVNDESTATTANLSAYGARLSRTPGSAQRPDTMASPPTTAWSAPSASAVISSPTLLAWDTTLVTTLGAKFTLNENNGYPAGNNRPINDNWVSPIFAVEFWHYGTDLCIKARVLSTNQASVWAWVDDEAVTAAPEVLTAAASQIPARYRITFSGVALRKVRVYLTQAEFGGLELAAASAVTPVVKPAVKGLIFGDSYIETASVYGTAPVFGLPHTASRVVGWEPFYAGQAGTGFTMNGGGGGKTIYGSSTRIAGITSVAPDFLVVCCSLNDDANYATVGAAATDFFAAVATALPATKIIVIGPPRTVTPTADRLANRDACAAAAAAAPNVIAFHDPIAEGWITAGNQATFIGGDNTHPLQVGYDYLGTMIGGLVDADLRALGV